MSSANPILEVIPHRRPGLPLVLGNDAAWSGWGRCLADADGPLWTSHVMLKGRVWRWPALREQLGALDALVSGMVLRVAVERAPSVYRAASRRGPHGRSGAGNQADIGYGLGQLSGPLLLWGYRPGVWQYPWEIEVNEWRAMWWRGAQTTGRAEAKRRAIGMIKLNHWEAFLPPETEHNSNPEHAYGDRGDVAEAILIAVGCARNDIRAPRGPVRER